jgi:hypothetical protein
MRGLVCAERYVNGVYIPAGKKKFAGGTLLTRALHGRGAALLLKGRKARKTDLGKVDIEVQSRTRCYLGNGGGGGGGGEIPASAPPRYPIYPSGDRRPPPR